MTEPIPNTKVDPETLVLRAKPRRAVRFRRHLLIGASAVGALAIAGVTWIGLSPAAIKPVKVGEAPATNLEARTRSPSETLSALPKSYSDVPILGPPLPGDLGGPLLEAQRAKGLEMDMATEQYSATVKAPGASTPSSSSPTSSLFVALAPRNLANLTATEPTAKAAVERPQVASQKLQAGTIITAHLVTGLNSDLPGVVIAQISEAVFDPPTGRQVLIPQGARLLGRYERASLYRQSRIQIMWVKLLMPDGRTISLPEARAADEAGFAGLSDRVDYHGGALLRGVLLSTLMGIAETAESETETDMERAVRKASGQTLNETGNRIVTKSLDAAPTLTVRPGWPVLAILTEDLFLSVYDKGGTHG